jgi:hypothetical protein
MEFNKKLCNEGLATSFQIYRHTIHVGALYYVYALVYFYLDRYISHLKENDRIDNLQLYERFPQNKNPVYLLSDLVSRTN